MGNSDQLCLLSFCCQIEITQSSPSQDFWHIRSFENSGLRVPTKFTSTLGVFICFLYYLSNFVSCWAILFMVMSHTHKLYAMCFFTIIHAHTHITWWVEACIWSLRTVYGGTTRSSCQGTYVLLTYYHSAAAALYAQKSHGVCALQSSSYQQVSVVYQDEVPCGNSHNLWVNHYNMVSHWTWDWASYPGRMLKYSYTYLNKLSHVSECDPHADHVFWSRWNDCPEAEPIMIQKSTLLVQTNKYELGANYITGHNNGSDLQLTDNWCLFHHRDGYVSLLSTPFLMY